MRLYSHKKRYHSWDAYSRAWHWLVPNKCVNESWVQSGLGSALRFRAGTHIISAWKELVIPEGRSIHVNLWSPKVLETHSALGPGKNEDTVMGQGVLKGVFKWNDEQSARWPPCTCNENTSNSYQLTLTIDQALFMILVFWGTYEADICMTIKLRHWNLMRQGDLLRET